MTQSPLGRVEQLIKSALKAGADAADAVAISGHSRSVSWREGKLEDVEGSEGTDIGLRAFVGRRQAITSTSNMTPAALDELVARTVAMAKAAPEDPHCGLLDEASLLSGAPKNLDLFDATDPGLDALKDQARAAEDAVRSVRGVTNSDGASASMSTRQIALATSTGFARTYDSTSFGVSVSAIAEADGVMERDYDYSSARHWADLDGATEIGRSAGNLTVRRLGAKQLKSGRMPVVFAPRVANSLIGHLVGAISGDAIARGSSFLKGAMNSEVFAPSVSIIDDPLRPRGLRSRPFDGEGAPTTVTHLIDKGVLKTWMLNAATARQLNLGITGHASRGVGSVPGISGSNLYMTAGPISPHDLIGEIDDGFYVTELIGMGVNGVTGDYSRGAAGLRIEGGTLTHAVSEVTIAGNLKDMFKNLTPANDLEFRYGINAPTVRIDGMTLAGA